MLRQFTHTLTQRLLPLGAAVSGMGAMAAHLATSGAPVAPGATGDVYNVGKATNIKFHEGMVPRAAKEELLKQRGVVIWFTGAFARARTRGGGDSEQQTRVGAVPVLHLGPSSRPASQQALTD